uniref:SJCHGC08793 protein n=1 Tax=Schistosoma japonicum TaxID=6182 RepID=Q5DHP6_SCHJA|nr:SJCHGC08793 protein [Schistosoma japonicum]
MPRGGPFFGGFQPLLLFGFPMGGNVWALFGQGPFSPREPTIYFQRRLGVFFWIPFLFSRIFTPSPLPFSAYVSTILYRERRTGSFWLWFSLCKRHFSWSGSCCSCSNCFRR